MRWVQRLEGLAWFGEDELTLSDMGYVRLVGKDYLLNPSSQRGHATADPSDNGES